MLTLLAVYIAGATAAALPAEGTGQEPPASSNGAWIPMTSTFLAGAAAVDCEDGSYAATPPAATVSIDDTWCNANCPLGNCPTDFCTCAKSVDEEQAAATGVQGPGDRFRNEEVARRTAEREKMKIQRTRDRQQLKKEREQRKEQNQRRMHPEAYPTPAPLAPEAAEAEEIARHARAKAKQATKRHCEDGDAECRAEERKAVSEAHRAERIAEKTKQRSINDAARADLQNARAEAKEQSQTAHRAASAARKDTKEHSKYGTKHFPRREAQYGIPAEAQGARETQGFDVDKRSR